MQEWLRVADDWFWLGIATAIKQENYGQAPMVMLGLLQIPTAWRMALVEKLEATELDDWEYSAGSTGQVEAI